MITEREWIADRVPHDRALAWIVGRDTGTSSKALWAHMVGVDPAYGWCDPGDGDDLGRCIRLLDWMPEWRPRLGEMAQRSAAWSGLIAHWDELEGLYRKGVEADRASPRYTRANETWDTLYNRMRAIRGDA